jgi:hypothetical protein
MWQKQATRLSCNDKASNASFSLRNVTEVLHICHLNFALCAIHRCNCMQALARRMQSLTTTRGTHVSEQGDEADCIFFLQRGTVEILHLGRPVSRLFAPCTFGEAALLRDDMDHAGTRLSGYRTTSTAMCAAAVGCAHLGIETACTRSSLVIQLCARVRVPSEEHRPMRPALTIFVSISVSLDPCALCLQATPPSCILDVPGVVCMTGAEVVCDQPASMQDLGAACRRVEARGVSAAWCARQAHVWAQKDGALF